MVVIDSTMLLLLLQPDALGPTDTTGAPVTAPRERVEHLVSELEKARIKIMIPTPVLSEVLVRAGAKASPKLVEELNKQSVFRIESFDVRAAIEVAAMSRTALAHGKKKKTVTGAASETYAKIKYDRQIVAMAKVAQASTIYSDDGGLRAVAEQAGIAVIGLAELDLPPALAQTELSLAVPPVDADDAEEADDV